MGTLAQFASYLEERLAVLDGAHEQLTALQGKYETFFQEIVAVREHELAQLTAAITGDRASVPAWLDQELHQAEAEVRAEGEAKLAALSTRRAELLAQIEAEREQSRAAEAALHDHNSAFDQEEEQLKARSDKLTAAIATHNQAIRALSSGPVGFFLNLFKMRALYRQQRALQEEQADVAARIDALRRRWQAESGEFSGQEQERAGRWVALQTELAALDTKREHLRAVEPRVLLRSTIERVLFRHRPAGEAGPATASGAAAPCPRCGQTSPERSFCAYCAQRLQPDRPDLAGSLPELAELNAHWERFSAGVQGCQEIIALVGGLRAGLAAFKKSVDGMRDTEKRYPLPKLAIGVPEASLRWGQYFEALAALAAGDHGLHPQAFAARIKQVAERELTADKIKAYFETMGQELTVQADRQWKKK